MFAQRLDSRSKEFMRGCDPEEAMKKREESHVELRKSKRSDRYMQKRGRRAVDPRVEGQDEAFTKLVLEATRNCAHLPITEDMSPRARLTCLCDTFRDTLDADIERILLERIVEVVSKENITYPLIHVGHSGILPKTLRLTASSDISIAKPASHVVSNVLTVTDDVIIAQLLECGAVSRLIANLTQGQEEVVDQCIWALSNIVGNREYKICLRDFVLDAGVLDAIVPLTDGLRKRSSPLVENLCWFLQNLSVGAHSLTLPHCEKMCWILLRCLNLESCVALTDSLGAFFEMTKFESELIPIVANSGAIPAVFRFLTHPMKMIRVEAIKVLANLTAFQIETVHAMVDLGLFDRLYELLSESEVEIQRESLWLLSNVFACGRERVETVIQHKLFPIVVHSLIDSISRIREEAIICLFNATCHRGLPTIQAIIALGGVELLCENLNFQDSKILQLVLDTILNLLEGTKRCDSAFSEIATRMESCTAHNKLDKLHQHRNVRIQHRVKTIYNLLDFHESLVIEETKTPSAFIFS